MEIKFDCIYGDNSKTVIELSLDSTILNVKETVKNRYNYSLSDKKLFIDGYLIEDDTTKLKDCRKGFDELLFADVSTIREQFFYFADQDLIDSITISNLLTIQSIENCIAKKIGFSLTYLVFNIQFGKVTNNCALEPFKSFNFDDNYVIPLCSKYFHQKNSSFQYPSFSYENGVMVKVNNTLNSSSASSTKVEAHLRSGNNTKGRSSQHSADIYNFMSLPSKTYASNSPTLYASDTTTSNTSNTGNINNINNTNNTNNINNKLNKNHTKVLPTKVAGISKTYTPDKTTGVSSVFTESTLNILRAEREGDPIHTYRQGQTSTEESSTSTTTTTNNSILTPSVNNGIPYHESISIQGIKDHIVISGKREFAEKDIQNFIYSLSTFPPYMDELYLENEQYYNFNMYRYAKLLYEKDAICCWFDYMISNTKNTFYLEHNIYILNNITIFQEEMCKSLLQSEYIKALTGLFEQTISTEAKSDIILILIRLIDTDAELVSTLLFNEVRYQTTIMRLKDYVPISDLLLLNQHLENKNIKDHTKLFTAFYADMSLCKTNASALTDIYKRILTDFPTINFTSQEVASFNNLIMNTDESFDSLEEFKETKNKLYFHLNPQSACCSIL